MFPFWISLRERLFDERFVLHRYKSTSHAGVAVALALAGWAVGLMVVVKLGFMSWYAIRE